VAKLRYSLSDNRAVANLNSSDIDISHLTFTLFLLVCYGVYILMIFYYVVCKWI